LTCPCRLCLANNLKEKCVAGPLVRFLKICFIMFTWLFHQDILIIFIFSIIMIYFISYFEETKSSIQWLDHWLDSLRLFDVWWACHWFLFLDSWWYSSRFVYFSINPTGYKVNDHVSFQWSWGLWNSNWWPLDSKHMVWPIELYPLKFLVVESFVILVVVVVF
jgi:hypothetical protein